MKRVSIISLCLTAILACGTGTFAFAMPMAASSCQVDSGLITAEGRGDYTSCIGPIEGNEGAMNFADLLAEVNTGVFDGITTWVPDAKFDADTGMVDAGPNNYDFQITGIPGNSGEWTITPPTTDALILTLKTNTYWSAYYFAEGALTGGGTWDTRGVSINNGFGQDLSHGTISFFTADPSPPGTTPTPEPSTMILLGSGLAGLTFWRRKKGAQS